MNASSLFYEKDRVALRGGGPKGTVIRVEDPDTVYVRFDMGINQAMSAKQLRRLPPHEAGEPNE